MAWEFLSENHSQEIRRKSEIRSPKSEANSKGRKPGNNEERFVVFPAFLIFRSLFRISIFEFRISPQGAAISPATSPAAH